MDEQEKSTVQDLLDVDLDAIVANGEEKKPKKKRTIFAIIIGVMLLLVLVLPNLAGSSEPIVGKWSASAVMGESGKVIPITDHDSNYVDIKKNGTFTLHLDGMSEETGTWKPKETSGDSKTEMFYALNFENGSVGGLLYEEDMIYFVIGDIGISFQK